MGLAHGFSARRIAAAAVVLLLTLFAAPAMAADTQGPTVVVTPSGSNQSGTFFSGNVDLSITATDNGGGKVSSIACVLDGDIGNTKAFGVNQSPVTRTIQNAFTTAGRHTYECGAQDNSGNTSGAPVTGAVSIDKVAPTVAAVASPSALNNGDITVTISASDPALPDGSAGSGMKSINFSSNNSGPNGNSLNSGTATVTITNAGSTTITYSATDKVNNKSADKTITVVIDKAKPTIVSALTPPSGVTATTGSIGFTATDTGGAGLGPVSLTVDGGPPSTSDAGGAPSTTVVFSTGAEGLRTATFTATDRAGNVADAVTATLLVDKTAPVASAVAAPSGGGQAVTISATDPLAGSPAASSGVKSISYSVDGGGTTTVNATSTTLPAFTSGTHTVTYTATDNAGNQSAPKTITVVMDSTPPTANASASPASPSNGTITVSVTAQDEVGGSGVKSITTSVNGGAPTTTPGATASLPFSAEGRYTVSYFATDNAGNASTPKTITVLVDKTAPTVGAGASPPSPSSSTITVNIAASDPTIGGGAGSGVASITTSVNGGAPSTTSGASAALSFAAEGTYTVSYFATDNAGNQSAPKTITVVVDKTAPVASASASPGTLSGGTITVTLSATDANGVASITASVNGGTPSTVAGASRTLTFSAQGRYTVTYFATDNAGNQSAPKTITVVVDKTAPSTTASASPGKVSNGPITVTFNATDPAVGGGPGAGVASITTSVNGAAPTTVAGATRSLTFTAEGTYTVTYFATDNVGNAGAPQTITVVIDATAPTARSTSSSSLTVLPQSGDSDAGPTLLEGTAADNRGVTKVRVRIHASGDSDLVYDQTFTASCPGCGPTNTPVNWSLNLSTLGLPSGLYDTEITAFDQAGNTTTIAGPRVFVQ